MTKITQEKDDRTSKDINSINWKHQIKNVQMPNKQKTQCSLQTQQWALPPCQTFTLFWNNTNSHCNLQ